MSFQVGDLVRPADFVVEQRYVVTAVGEQMLIAKPTAGTRESFWPISDMELAPPKRYVIEMRPARAGERIVVLASRGAWTTAPTAVRNVVEAVVVEELA